jgi:glycosyltransferase involved in cell wall biosynthesis/phosphoheptose isomerase
MISEHASPLSILGGVDSGGQNVYVGHIARHLAAAGYQVDVFTRRDNAEAPEIVRWTDGVRVVHVPAGPPEVVSKERLLPHMEEFTAYMLRFCRQIRHYSLAHANFWMSGLVAAELKQHLGMPFVITFHALGRIRRMYQRADDGFPDERFAIEDRIVAEADQIIAECPQDEEDLIRLYNADPARITIVPCGFDPAELWPIPKAAARAHLSIEADDRVILQLGRMVPRKGIDNVVRGLARLVRHRGVDAQLLVVGGECDDADPTRTPEIARVQAIAAEEGVPENVRFTGRCRRAELKYYYSAADVFVTTPWYEPFGITPVEAMACGTPVIGSNVGGIKFTVRDAETGYLIPPNDPEALAERIADLYKHPKLMSVLSRQGIRRVNDLFTWEKVASALSKTYDEVLTAGLHERGHELNQFETLDRGFREAVEVLSESSRRLRASLYMVADALCDCFADGGKVLICGNGGGAFEAQRIAANFIGRLKRSDRPGLPVIWLSSDPAPLAGLSSDVGSESILERQVEAFGLAGDVLLGIGDGSAASNVEHAFSMARRLGLRCVAITGQDGGDLVILSDLTVIVPSSDTQRIQEVQRVIANLLCELVEERFVFRRRLEQPPAPPRVVLKLPERLPVGRDRIMPRQAAS